MYIYIYIIYVKTYTYPYMDVHTYIYIHIHVYRYVQISWALDAAWAVCIPAVHYLGGRQTRSKDFYFARALNYLCCHCTGQILLLALLPVLCVSVCVCSSLPVGQGRRMKKTSISVVSCWLGSMALAEQNPDRSKHPLFKTSGPKASKCMVFGTRDVQYLVARKRRDEKYGLEPRAVVKASGSTNHASMDYRTTFTS